MNGRLVFLPADDKARRAPWQALRSLCLYVIAAVAATAFFFWLHHLGNGIPYELAQQRFAAGPLTGTSDSEVRIASEFEYCEIAAAVLAGAAEKSERGELVDAVLLRVLRTQSHYTNYCAEVRAASTGADLGSHLIKFRYWWGGKAIFAIALRWLSVVEFRRFIEITTYLAWLLFAGAMALHGWRALTVALPLVAFGLAFSGVSDFSGAANGLPYLWTVATAALFSLLLLERRMARWAGRFCFASGMVSSYLWHFDGHNFIVVALLAAVAWLALEGAVPRIRARRALGYVAFYVAGFAICFALGQLTKAMIFDETYGQGDVVLGGPVAQDMLGQVMYHLDRIAQPEGRDGLDLTRWAFAASTHWLTARQGGLVIDFSVAALAGAAASAVFQARRLRKADSGWTCLWFVTLMLAVGVLYVLPNNTPVRSARYLFLPLALCWCCLVAAAGNLWGLRGSLVAAAGALIVAAWPGGLVLLKQRLWQDDIERALVGEAPVARADFDVYLVEGGERVVYVKDPCIHGGRPPWAESPRGGWYPTFFLNVYRKDTLIRERVEFQFFEADFAMRDDSRCVAMQSLPESVAINSIETGQFDSQSILWAVNIQFMGDNLCDALSTGTVYGNNAVPYAIHSGSGGEACSVLPESGIWDEIADSSDARDAVSRWREKYAKDGDHLVWIHDAGASRLPGYDAADLRGRAALKEVARLGGSTVFRVDAGLSDESGGDYATWRSIVSEVPAARSLYDVHIDERRIVYFKAPCTWSDTTSRFFLHVFPANVGSLPERRAGHGFENLDFDFASIGSRFDGKCMAIKRLPVYSAAYARTGQFDVKGVIWAVEISLDAASSSVAGTVPAASISR